MCAMAWVLREITDQVPDRTTVVTLEVPIAYVDEVRSVYRAHEYRAPGVDERSERRCLSGWMTMCWYAGAKR